MKKPSYIKFGFVTIIGMLSLAVMGCPGGGSSSSSNNTVTPAATLSGAVAKGYVEGARVIADKVPTGQTIGNLQFDRTEGEVFDISTSLGDYVVEVPENYGEFVLFSLGGTDNSTNQPAPPMMAPSDAGNITPVTTLVSLNSSLKEKIGAARYDQDIAADTGADGDVLALAMTVKTSLESLTANVALTDTQKMNIAKAMADEFNDVDDLKDVTKIASATNAAVQKVVADETIFDPEVIVMDKEDAAEAIQTAVTNIVSTIDMNNKVVEQNIIDDVQDEIEATKTAVDNTITSIVRIKLNIVSLKDAGNNTITLIDGNKQSITGMGPTVYYAELTPAKANAVNTITYSLTGENTYPTKSYTGAQLILDINDTLTLREATVTVSGVTLTVANGGAVTVAFSANTTLKVEGTTGAGETVSATFTNTTVQGDANIVTVANNSVTLNLAALDDKIEASTDDDVEPLFDISRTGKFKVNISVANSPVVGTAKTIYVK